MRVKINPGGVQNRGGDVLFLVSPTPLELTHLFRVNSSALTRGSVLL